MLIFYGLQVVGSLTNGYTDWCLTSVALLQHPVRNAADREFAALGSAGRLPVWWRTIRRYGRRMASPGDLDTSFSGDGKKTINFGGIDAANAVLVQPNG